MVRPIRLRTSPWSVGSLFAEYRKEIPAAAAAPSTIRRVRDSTGNETRAVSTNARNSTVLRRASALSLGRTSWKVSVSRLSVMKDFGASSM